MKGRRFLDHRAQFVNIHRWNKLGMSLNEVAEFGIVHRSIIEISTQGDNDDDRTLGLCCSSYQQINKVLPVLFRRLRKKFLKLIHHKHYFCPWRFHQLKGLPIQPACPFCEQIIVDSFDRLTPFMCKDKRKRFNRACTWSHWSQIDPVFTSRKHSLP